MPILPSVGFVGDIDPRDLIPPLDCIDQGTGLRLAPFHLPEQFEMEFGFVFRYPRFPGETDIDFLSGQ